MVNSPGGLVQSSYKVARASRKTFKEISVFVPHIAASGGTLLALTGNKIVMGMRARKLRMALYRRTLVGVHQFVTRLFDDVTVDDAPYRYKAPADKCDGVDIRDAFA